MISILTSLLTHPLVIAATVFRTDDYDYEYGSDEGGAWFWLLGPVGGFGFFMWVFLRYRNTDKRHAFEHESATELRDLKTYDQRVDRISGTSNSTIDGRNSHKPLVRLGAGTTIVEIPAPKPIIEEVLDAAAAPSASQDPDTPNSVAEAASEPTDTTPQAPAGPDQPRP